MLGVVILLLMMATAFMGYVLPWGQMSFWGATVITNLFSAIPLIGESIVTWLWGGFSVDNPTLGRFFALHYLMPFVIVAVVMLHLIALHRFGSGNPLGMMLAASRYDSFSSLLHEQRPVWAMVFLTIFASAVFFYPNYLGILIIIFRPIRCRTPAHIVPEWYFLPFYAILRGYP